MLLEAGAEYTRADDCGNPILGDVALYGGLGTIEFFRAVERNAIYIKATNKKGKRALEKAQQREGMPHEFVEAFQAILDAIRDQGFADDSRNSTVENDVSEAQQDDLGDVDAPITSLMPGRPTGIG